jgi:hypothetical protein
MISKKISPLGSLALCVAAILPSATCAQTDSCGTPAKNTAVTAEARAQEAKEILSKKLVPRADIIGVGTETRGTKHEQVVVVFIDQAKANADTMRAIPKTCLGIHVAVEKTAAFHGE